MDVPISRFRPTLISMSVARLRKTIHRQKCVQAPKIVNPSFLYCKNIWIYCFIIPFMEVENLLSKSSIRGRSLYIGCTRS